jgi:sugar phosphate isomerase/epimerase
MIQAGLTSITFRRLTPDQVVDLAARAGLRGIEWGGDIHVPHGDIAAASRARALCDAAGLQIPSYGSYYRLGAEPPDRLPRVIETAQALGARIVRVWAGRAGSATSDDTVRHQVAVDGRRAAELAAAAGLRIACEWHGNTLTDTAASAAALFAAVDHPAFGTYWQPHPLMQPETCLADMDAALPHLIGVHVYQWHIETRAREALAAGAGVWPLYLRKAAAAGDFYALLEFVRDDDPALLAADAATLNGWLREAAVANVCP